MKKTIFLYIALSVMLFVIGCAPDQVGPVRMYEGPEKPLDQVATLYARPPHPKRESVQITSIDGKRMGQPTIVYILPGEHQIGLQWRFEYASGPASGIVFLNLVAGHAYEARGSYQGASKVKLWLEDKGKGYVVRESDFVN
ncbi:MAG: hypothetical protein ACYC9K_09885 [Sulfuricaulis sp.]